MDRIHHKVAVRCFTFNHDRFIKDTLSGFVLQRTRFPVVYIIVDDASTDNTPLVIRNFLDEQFNLNNKDAFQIETDYARISFAPHKLNNQCWFVALLLKENHFSQNKDKNQYLTEWISNAQYEALCEGDDYWIDPNKLQIQVDFMEAHHNCSLVFHNAFKEDGATGVRVGIHKIYKKSCYVPLLPIMRDGGFIPTASILCRRTAYKGIDRFPTGCCGDMRFQIYGRLSGDAYYINKTMSVYRLVNSSATHLLMHDMSKFIENENKNISWLNSVNSYTGFQYNKEITKSIAFCEARIIVAKKEFHKLWAPKYYAYINNKPIIVRIGLLIAMLGFGKCSLWAKRKAKELKLKKHEK